MSFRQINIYDLQEAEILMDSGERGRVLALGSLPSYNG
jgi:hypothetical protein